MGYPVMLKATAVVEEKNAPFGKRKIYYAK
jgi:hypothetical protein